MEYCNNEKCSYKNKCRKYVYLNEKVVSEYWRVVKDHESCGECNDGEK